MKIHTHSTNGRGCFGCCSVLLLTVMSILPSFYYCDASSNTNRDSSHRTQHTSNHAVLVSSSRYWFNYRHAINAMSFYRLIKDHGIPDSNIVLMIADEFAMNARNPLPNQLQSNGQHGRNLYGDDTEANNNDDVVEIDYRGDDVRVEQFIQVLMGTTTAKLSSRPTNRHRKSRRSTSTPPPVLHTDDHSNVLIYLTGHGGDQFFKFQDSEEILATQLASTIQAMYNQNKYHRILLVADTCQAFTLGDKITAPNVTIIGSSLRGESSYAHHTDDILGLSVIERYTHAVFQFLTNSNGRNGQSKSNPKWWYNLSLQQGLIDPYPYETQRAHIGVKDNTSYVKVDELRMSDFLTNEAAAQVRTAVSSRSQIRLLPDSMNDDRDGGWTSLLGGGKSKPLGQLTPSDIRSECTAVVEDPLGSVPPPPTTAYTTSSPGWDDGMELTDPLFVSVLIGMLSMTAWLLRR